MYSLMTSNDPLNRLFVSSSVLFVLGELSVQWVRMCQTPGEGGGGRTLLIQNSTYKKFQFRNNGLLEQACTFDLSRNLGYAPMYEKDLLSLTYVSVCCFTVSRS